MVVEQEATFRYFRRLYKIPELVEKKAEPSTDAAEPKDNPSTTPSVEGS